MTADTVSVSIRDVHDVAYRALRVRGTPSGLASVVADGVQDLEVHYASGLAHLKYTLQGTGLPTHPRPRAGPDKTVHIESAPGGGLLAAPAVAEIAAARPDIAVCAVLDSPWVLEPFLIRAAIATGRQLDARGVSGQTFCTAVPTDDGVAVPAASSHVGPVEVWVSSQPPITTPSLEHTTRRSKAWHRALTQGLSVDADTWRQVAAVGSKFLV